MYGGSGLHVGSRVGDETGGRARSTMRAGRLGDRASLDADVSALSAGYCVLNIRVATVRDVRRAQNTDREVH